VVLPEQVDVISKKKHIVRRPADKSEQCGTARTHANLEGERKPQWERENVVCDEVERSAEVLSALPAEDAAAGVGEAVCDLGWLGRRKEFRGRVHFQFKKFSRIRWVNQR
jgi:hypothetical protein